MSVHRNDSAALAEGIEAFDLEDYSKAMKLLLPLAENGIVQAQCCIGSLYHGGLGVPVNGVIAVDWYLKAAIQNEEEGKVSAIAYNNLGTIFSSGLPDVPADIERAKDHWRKAVGLGFEMIPDDWLE